MPPVDLASRILAALAVVERDADGAVVRVDQLVRTLDVEVEVVRTVLYALDTAGVVRFTRGFVAGDVVVLPAGGRSQLGQFTPDVDRP